MQNLNLRVRDRTIKMKRNGLIRIPGKLYRIQVRSLAPFGFNSNKSS